MKKMLAIGVAAGVTLCAAAFVFMDNPVAQMASLISSQNTVQYAQCLRTFTEASHNNFTFREVELNGDGRDDVLVHQTAGDSCGSAGCIYEICVRDHNQNYTHIPFGYAAKTITVMETKSSGMSDLILNEDKNLKMIWDGTQYILED